jgi:isopentenyl diphosphate isomerase/L-lactate dehydrogenase-like FMN-dependent dehydrogenase
VKNFELKVQSVEDARYFAERRLPKFLYQLYESGTGPGVTLRDNVAAFEKIAFMPRAAVSFPERSQKTTVVGHEVSTPVLLAPVGALRTGAPGHGELAVAKAAGAAGTIQMVSSFTGYSIEEITAVATGPVFFQLFYLGGRKNAEIMIDRAAKAGCGALVVTVDIAAPGGARERAYRDRVHFPTGTGVKDTLLSMPQMLTSLGWVRDFARDGKPAAIPMFLDENGVPKSTMEGVSTQLDEIPVWDDLPWLRDIWNGPLILKGIMTADDARRARDAGVDAIIVSNHGGNHLDGGAPSIEVLPAVADAVGGEIEIIFDGGIRRGSDVVKALAMGATATAIGRGYVYPLLAGGETGVRHILDMFRREIDETMASIGCGRVTDLDRSYLRIPASW